MWGGGSKLEMSCSKKKIIKKIDILNEENEK